MNGKGMIVPQTARKIYCLCHDREDYDWSLDQAMQTFRTSTDIRAVWVDYPGISVEQRTNRVDGTITRFERDPLAARPRRRMTCGT